MNKHWLLCMKPNLDLFEQVTDTLKQKGEKISSFHG